MCDERQIKIPLISTETDPRGSYYLPRYSRVGGMYGDGAAVSIITGYLAFSSACSKLVCLSHSSVTFNDLKGLYNYRQSLSSYALMLIDWSSLSLLQIIHVFISMKMSYILRKTSYVRWNMSSSFWSLGLGTVKTRYLDSNSTKVLGFVQLSLQTYNAERFANSW